MIEVSLRRPAVVDFNQADTDAVVHSREQRGVKARRQCRRDAGLQWFVGARPAAVSSAACAGVILPVVIRSEERSIAVAQFQRRIGQRIRHSRRREAGANTAHHNPVVHRCGCRG